MRGKFILIISAALLALSFLTTIISPSRLWIVVVFQIAYGPLLLWNIILAVWAALKRSKSVVIPLAVILPALLFVGRYWHRPSRELPEGDPDLKIITYNVGAFGASKTEKDAVKNREALLDYLVEQDADIICLQEFRLNNTQDPAAMLKRYFKGYHVVYGTVSGLYNRAGLVTICRYPVKSRNSIRFEGTGNLILWTDFVVRGKTYRIYNCHLESYRLPLKKMLQGDDDALVRGSRNMKKHAGLRSGQVDEVIHHINEKCPVPAIVCGDFNDTPLSYSYRCLRRGRRDTFKDAGTGFGASFSSFWPLLRIDYVLYPELLGRALSHESPHLTYSDHYPVITTFEVRK